MNLRVLTIGVGNMGASHAKAYAKLPGYELVGLVARSEEPKKSLALELGGVSTFIDYKTAIHETNPDVVSINTYPDTHEEIALYSLDHGAHIFLEKPMSTTVEGAKRIKAFAEQKKLKVVIGYILRHHPSWQKFIRLAQDLGKPLVMRMNLNQQSYGPLWQVHKNLMKSMSPIVDCGVHYVDIMSLMTKSRPTSVYAQGARLTDEVDSSMYNYGMLQVAFEDGSVGWYESGWGPMMSTTAYFVKDVIGPMGSVSIVEPKHSGSDIENHVRTTEIVRHFTEKDKEDEFISMNDEPDHQELCNLEQSFLHRAITEDLDLGQHLEDAINSLRIVLAADQSIKEKRVIKL